MYTKKQKLDKLKFLQLFFPNRMAESLITAGNGATSCGSSYVVAAGGQEQQQQQQNQQQQQPQQQNQQQQPITTSSVQQQLRQGDDK
jgi:hypothetical protein